VKLERSVSPAGSVISVGPSVPLPPPKSIAQAPITYAGIKKKKKKPFESDDDGMSITIGYWGFIVGGRKGNETDVQDEVSLHRLHIILHRLQG
jgi:hypothetical protein